MRTETDRELLELAARASGIPLWSSGQAWYEGMECGLLLANGRKLWNPLTDDGDALRLAVELNLLVDCASYCARPLPDSIEWQEASGPDGYAATRRAIVRAAAQIGMAMP